MKHLIYILLLVCVFPPGTVSAQEWIDTSLLSDPKKNGPEIAALLRTEEIYEFVDTTRNTFFLENGFRSSRFINEAAWLAIKDTVEVYRIDVVYSKYPLRKGTYYEIYPLLFNRLRKLFALDEDLNSSEIDWVKILQTHCENDQQVDKLKHGIRIWYRPIPEEVIDEKLPEKLPLAEDRTAGSRQSDMSELKNSYAFIQESSFFSDSLKAAMKDKPIDVQRKIVTSLLEKELKKTPAQDLNKIDKIKQTQYIEEIKKLQNYYMVDSTVFKILSRHPEWQNAIVVNDWTGSMYGYGTQVVQWHLLNHQISGIKQITLFNDGDEKPTFKKKIGETGGIYTDDADNIERLMLLFQLVMSKGGGGDGPENDVEAILKAIELKNGDVSEVILIADNYPCVRDVSLIDRVTVPVRVIVCGYNPKHGVNPDLAYIAQKTNGGLYTIEKDIENLSLVFTEPGKVDPKSAESQGLKLANMRCESNVMEHEVVRKSIKATRFKLKKEVEHLDLSSCGLDKVHPRIHKLSHLKSLNLSNNQLRGVPENLGELLVLKSLNLSNNQLTKLPDLFKSMRYLMHLDLSNNQLEQVPKNTFNQPFLVELDLSNNVLVSLPKLGNMGQLNILDLSNNQLKSIPSSFSHIRHITQLNLDGNQLAKLPLCITKMRPLEELYLRNNLLTVLPKEIKLLTHLSILHLEGNAFSEEEQIRIRELLPNTMVYF